MSDEQPLLAAIRARPDDDAPRLAYADWLHGRDEPRAEFIRVQCHVAHCSDDAAARAREHSLWVAHHERWVAELPDWILRADWRLRFRRGFADVIVVKDPHVFWSHLGEIVVMTQLPCVLSLSPIGIDIDHFAVSPDLRRVAQLHRVETGAFDWQGAVETLSIFDRASRAPLHTSERTFDDHRVLAGTRPEDVRFSADSASIVISRSDGPPDIESVPPRP